MVRDNKSGEVVGTYRMMGGAQARQLLGFYSEKEFDLSRIKKLDGELLELGGMPYCCYCARFFNIKVTVGGDEGQLERTAPLAAPLRSLSVIVPTTLVYKSIDDAPVRPARFALLVWRHGFRVALPEAVRTAQHRGADNDPAQDRIFCYRDNSAGRKILAEDCYDRVLGRVTETSLDQDEESEEDGEPLLPT